MPDRAFFHNLAYISVESDRIFIKKFIATQVGPILYAVLLRNTTFGVLPATQYIVLNLTVKPIGATQPNTANQNVRLDL